MRSASAMIVECFDTDERSVQCGRDEALDPKRPKRLGGTQLGLE